MGGALLKISVRQPWISRKFYLVLLIKSFDTVDRGILDRVLKSLGCGARSLRQRTTTASAGSWQ